MKRTFVFSENGLGKEAPFCLKETPQMGSCVSYCGQIYTVINVIYDFENKIIVTVLKLV
jgi:hypothetical protein